MTCWFGLIAALAVAGFAAVVQFSAPDPVVGLRDLVFDTYQRLYPRESSARPVLVIDVDDESLARLGQWPWPRTILAEIVLRLKDAGTAVVAFDVLFAEPDRASPARVLTPFMNIPEVAAAIPKLPDGDTQLAASMSQVAAVTAFTLIPEPNTRRPEAKARIVLRGSDAIPSAVPSFQGTVASLPLLEAAAAGNGSINFAPSRDGIIRHVPLVLDLNGELVPGLAAEIVRLLRRKRSVVVNVEGSAISAVRLGSVPVQPDAGGLLWLHYRAGDPAVYIPAWRLLSPDFTEPRLKGAAAIVGTSAKGLQDIRFTPLGELVPGVDVHVQAVEQALADTFLRRPQWAEGLEVLLTLILGIVLAVIGTLMRARLSATGLVVIAGGALVTGFFLFRGERLLVDPAPSVIGGVCAYLVAALWQLAYRERQNRFIRGAFAQYISPNLVGYLIENPESLSLGGERRECSFVLTDLAGFTATVEQSSPVELTAVLNAYLEGMVDIAFRHDETLDRIVGDAVAVMFAAPVDQPDHRRRALACAVDMDDFAQQFVAKHRPAHPTLTGTRIGVNSGPVVVGNFGGERVFDYRALGDAVNVTARLESANRHLGTRVCVAEESLRDLDVAVRPIGKLLLAGKSEPIFAFEPIVCSGLSASEAQYYELAYVELEAGNSTALKLFQEYVSAVPEDGLARFHLDRLERGEAGSMIILEK